MNVFTEQIKKLQKEKDAVILAHYYVNPELQEVADYVGDSYYLSKKATEIAAKTIVVCGVSFMGESVQLLNPNKTVLLPEPEADCPMAHMVDERKVEAMRQQYEDLAVVCYVNSSAKLKAVSDICVTSANAYDVVKSLPNHNIFFIPDEHLGRFIASKLPKKNFILNEGYCPVHKTITATLLKQVKQLHPKAKILVHPECCNEVCNLADYIGSTAGIIEYATKENYNEFIIGTEIGVAYELRKRNPQKNFYLLEQMCCSDMKKITLEKVIACLRSGSGKVHIDGKIMKRAVMPLERMLKLSVSTEKREGIK